MAGARILGFVDDLLFASRIEAAARALGARWQRVSSAAEARSAHEEARSEGGRVALVLLDLGCRSGDALELARELRAGGGLAGVPLVAFGSHVHAERLEQAREAGCDQALPNSALAAGLAQLLKGHLGG
jgi:CheY-like chemotaxis protein